MVRLRYLAAGREAATMSALATEADRDWGWWWNVRPDNRSMEIPAGLTAGHEYDHGDPRGKTVSEKSADTEALQA